MILHPEALLLIPIFLFFTNKKNIFFVISAIFLVLAISGIAKKEIKKVKILNSDIFLLIDTTYSMMADDLKPNRLEYAKKEIIKLIKKINKPIGIVSFDKNVKILQLPTLKKDQLIEKVKSLTPKKARTDIQMAINKIDSITNVKKTIVVISDGGDKEVRGDFIFWAFATKKGANIPDYDGISKLNLIGKKVFHYDEREKLINFLNSIKNYDIKEVFIYKPIVYPFVIGAFIFFIIGIVFSRFKILILIFLLPNYAKASILGCFYEYIGLKQKAIKEYKKDNSDFSKMKLTIYYINQNRLNEALKTVNSIKNHPKKRYIKALILIKMKKYNLAYNLLKNKNLNQDELTLYQLVKDYKKIKTKIFPIEKSQIKKSQNIKKENEW